jgi:hypothetical protein
MYSDKEMIPGNNSNSQNKRREPEMTNKNDNMDCGVAQVVEHLPRKCEIKFNPQYSPCKKKDDITKVTNIHFALLSPPSFFKNIKLFKIIVKKLFGCM